MRILHIIGSIGPLSFGLGRAALGLAGAQLKLGHKVEIWCTDSREVCDSEAVRSGIDARCIRAFRSYGPPVGAFSPSMLMAAASAGDSFDVVHQHGVYTAISLVSLMLGRHRRVKRIVAPHGALEEKVMKKSALKKALALFLFERKNLEEAACLHAVGSNEYTDFRKLRLKTPIAIIPNGIEDAWLDKKGDGACFREEIGIPSKDRILLFMSRITPKKGLLMLVEAWSRIHADFSDWTVVIVGPDEGGHLAEVQSAAYAAGLSDRLVFAGPRYGDERWDALASADVFILPSISEGFPMVVLEALSCAVPAVVTHASAWEELVAHRCGWWVPADTDAIQTALVSAMRTNRVELQKMGLNGFRLVKDKYRIESSAEKSISLYEWVCEDREAPSFVKL